MFQEIRKSAYVKERLCPSHERRKDYGVVLLKEAHITPFEAIVL